MTTSDVATPPRVGEFPPPPQPVGPRTASVKPQAAVRRVELTAAMAATRWMLLTISALAIWLFAFALVFSGIQEHRAQHTLYAEFRAKLAKQTARIGTSVDHKPIPIGEPVVMLNAPAANISNLIVVEGTSSAQLRSGPGHRRDTVLPGQLGVSKMYGRSVTFGGPFAHITDFKPGDEIWAVTGQGRFLYHVTEIRRPGDRNPPPLPSGGSRLTLVTSTGHGWRSGWAPTGTVYVDATLVKPKAAASPGVQAVAADEGRMTSDTSTLVATVFWLQGLVLAAIGCVWAWRRWGRWQTWTVGTAVLVALLWGASSSAAALLPNLI